MLHDLRHMTCIVYSNVLGIVFQARCTYLGFDSYTIKAVSIAHTASILRGRPHSCCYGDPCAGIQCADTTNSANVESIFLDA